MTSTGAVLKKRITLAIIAAIAAIVAVAFVLYDTADVFTGTRVKNPDAYAIEFTEMNQTDTFVLPLEAGNELALDYDVSRGKLDLVIGLDGAEPAFKGNSLGTAKSSIVRVEEAGDYTVTVTGKHAAGFLSVKLVS